MIFHCSLNNRSRLAPTTSVLSRIDRKSTRLNSSHVEISYAVFCLKKKMLNYKASPLNHACRPCGDVQQPAPTAKLYASDAAVTAECPATHVCACNPFISTRLATRP